MPWTSRDHRRSSGGNNKRGMLPLSPAFATTIHKMQGQSMDEGSAVSTPKGNSVQGLRYVKYSRFRTLEMLHLRNRVTLASLRSGVRAKERMDFERGMDERTAGTMRALAARLYPPGGAEAAAVEAAAVEVEARVLAAGGARPPRPAAREDAAADARMLAAARVANAALLAVLGERVAAKRAATAAARAAARAAQGLPAAGGGRVGAPRGRGRGAGRGQGQRGAHSPPAGPRQQRARGPSPAARNQTAPAPLRAPPGARARALPGGPQMSAVLVPFLLAVADRLDVLRGLPAGNRAATTIRGFTWADHRTRMRNGGWFPDEYVQSAANDLFVRRVDVPIVAGGGGGRGFPLYVEAADQERLLVEPNAGGGAGGGRSTVPSDLLETCLTAYATLHLQPGGGAAQPQWAVPLNVGVWSQAQAGAVLAARAAAAANAAAPLPANAIGPAGPN